MDSIRYLLTIRNRLEDNVRSPSGKSSSEASEEVNPVNDDFNYLRDVMGFDLFGSGRKLGDADLSVKFNEKYKANPKYTRGDSGLVNTGFTGLLFESNRPANVIDASWINNYNLQLNPLLPFIAVTLFLSPVITIPTIFAQDSLQRTMDWYSKTFGIGTAS
jgi:hypothetical protein